MSILSIYWNKQNARAMQLLSKCNNTSALEVLRKTIKRTHDYAAYNNLGYFYSNDSDGIFPSNSVSVKVRARRMLTLAIVCNYNAISLENLGQQYFETKEYEAAAKCFQKADPMNNSPLITYNVGICYFFLHQYNLAYDCLRSLSLCEDQIVAYGGDAPQIAEAFTAPDDKRSIVLSLFRKNHPKEITPDVIHLMYLCKQFQEVIDNFELLVSIWNVGKHEIAVLSACCMEERNVYEKKRNAIKRLLQGKFYIFLHFLYNVVETKAEISKYRYTPPIAKRCGYFNCALHSNDQRLLRKEQ